MELALKKNGWNISNIGQNLTIKILRIMEKTKNNQTEKIVLTWTEKEAKDVARVGAMYCFKVFDINVN